MSLFGACEKEDIDQVKSLIEEQNNVTEVDDQGRTALHYCCDHFTIDCASLLLENESTKNIILNLQDSEGCSALHLACLNGNATIVKYLCEQGADVKLVDNERHSLIHWITVCGHLDLFDILVQYQAPIHTADINGAFPIHYASQLCGNDDPIKGLAILKQLIDYNVDVNCIDEQKRTPFIWAASAGAIDALRILYKVGANPLYVDKDSLSALHCAATRGHASCIRMLVELYDCPIDGVDVNGCTALFYAVTLKHARACQILLDLKANPNHQDNRGRTPSHCAILQGNLDCLKRLIKYNANIWIQNKRGDYPVHEAIKGISFYKVPNQKNDVSQSQSEFYDVLRYIFHLYPKKINVQNSESKTALHLAASLGDITMCKVLIECGARVNVFFQTSAGNFITPYDLARIRSQEYCAEYLIHHHGGQRGNLLAQIFARRLQKFFHRYHSRKSSSVDQRRKIFAKTTPTNKKSSTVKSIPSRRLTEDLLYQAKICLDNKIIDDQRVKSNTYLIENNVTKDEEETNAKQRRHSFAKSKGSMSFFSHTHDDESHTRDKIIIHTANSIATSVKLYERHKFLAEELFKLKQARTQDRFVIVNRPLYKILIENAYNPQNRHIDEIEKYIETLLKAYETELEAIRKRTKRVPSKRTTKDNNKKNIIVN